MFAVCILEAVKDLISDTRDLSPGYPSKITIHPSYILSGL